MASKDYKPRFITPAGKALFSHVAKPDFTFRKEGMFNIALVLDPSAVGLIEANSSDADLGSIKDYIDSVVDENFDSVMNDSAVKASKKKKLEKNYPYSEEILEDEDGNETITGKLIWKFSTLSQFTYDGETVKKSIPVCDADGAKINLDGSEIGNGSIVRVCFQLGPYYVGAHDKAGVKLYLSEVQVLNMVEGKSSKSAFGSAPKATTDVPF